MATRAPNTRRHSAAKNGPLEDVPKISHTFVRLENPHQRILASRQSSRGFSPTVVGFPSQIWADIGIFGVEFQGSHPVENLILSTLLLFEITLCAQLLSETRNRA